MEAQMLTEKANAICLLKVLAEYSDEKHILPMREIISKMKQDYGIAPDRRTIYSTVTMLNNIGYDISTYEENGVGYYLKQRLFEPGEMRLLNVHILVTHDRNGCGVFRYERPLG